MPSARPRRRWVALLVVGLAVGIFGGGVQQALHGLLSRERWNWAEMAVYALAVGLVMPWSWRLGWMAVERGWVPQNPSAAARARRVKLVSPALRTGSLPADADPDVWRPALRAAVQESKSQRWVSVAFSVVGGGLIGAAAVVVNDNAWGIWAVAVLVVAEGLMGFRLWSTRLRVAQQLHAEVAPS